MDEIVANLTSDLFTRKDIPAFAVMLILDLVWITVVMQPWFALQIKQVQGRPMRINYVSAAMSYCFLLLAYYTFIKGNKEATAKTAFLLGLCLYGVYEATTMALLRDWRWSTVMVDTLWGGVLFWLTFKLSSSFP